MSRSLNTVSRVVANTQKSAQVQAFERNNARGFHGSLRRHAILMPAMSPLMNECTITRWKKKEGESFVPGDVLLQIESDIAMIDVEAHSPGILGKIILPDGTKNVPVEQVIALVARDQQELAALQSADLNLPTPPPLSFIPSPPSATLDRAKRTRPPPTNLPHTPSPPEVQAISRGPRMTPRSSGPLASGFKLHPTTNEMDGVAIRRKIVVNLTGSQPKPYMRERNEYS